MSNNLGNKAHVAQFVASRRTEEATFEATYFYTKTYIFDFFSGIYENVTDLLDLRKQKLRNGLRGNHILWPSNQGKEL